MDKVKERIALDIAALAEALAEENVELFGKTMAFIDQGARAYFGAQQFLHRDEKEKL